MTRKTVQKILKGITDKIECNTADIDDWAEFWGFTREEYEEFLDMPFKALEQESKPMVEIDLYSVIKQKYIEREVLDKLRAEIDKARFVDKDTRICKNALASGLEVALQIIDKYKGESVT